MNMLHSAGRHPGRAPNAAAKKQQQMIPYDAQEKMQLGALIMSKFRTIILHRNTLCDNS
jgi:hypothetical protein